jgi:hypothetical protein
MAIDTRIKRASVVGVGRVYLRGKMSEAISESWRHATGESYAGTVLSPPVGGGSVLSLVQHGGLANLGGLVGEGGGLAG